MVALIPWAVLLLVVALSVVVYGFHPILRRRYRAFPGPRPKWLRGNVDEVIKRHIFGAYDLWQQQHGQLFLCWLGSRPVVVTTHGPTAKRIMLRQPTRPPLAGPAEIPFSRDNRYLKHDLLTTQDPGYHRSLKRTGWLPAFRGASIAQSAACMDAGARELVARLGRVADLKEDEAAKTDGRKTSKANKEINLWRMMGEVTLDVVFRAAFGLELGTQQDAATRPERATRLIEAAKAVFEVGQRSTRYFVVAQALPPLRPLVRVLATLFPDAALRRVTAARGLVFRTVEQLLAEKKRERAAGAGARGSSSSAAAAAPAPAPTPPPCSPSAPASRPPSAVSAGCFIDSLLDATHDDGSPWHDDEIVEACLTFALAAYETTATAISFACYGLCLNPGARERVAAQLDARPVGAKSPAELLETFAEDYPMVDACLAEALRLWPPGAITIRKAATDDDGRGNTEVLGFSGDGDGSSSPKRYLVPKGTWMHSCIWSIHRDARVWPRAEEFLPERFLSPQQAKEAKEAAGAGAAGGGGAGGGGAAATAPPAPKASGEETPLDLYAASAEGRSHYYFPFGDGALSCVGRRFAEAEARVVLARVFSEFEFELSPGQIPLNLRAPLTLGPVEGIFVTPIRREKKRDKGSGDGGIGSAARPKTPGTPPQL